MTGRERDCFVAPAPRNDSCLYVSVIGIWGFEFVWNLEFEIWDFLICNHEVLTS
jgi:hypothetical protein